MRNWDLEMRDDFFEKCTQIVATLSSTDCVVLSNGDDFIGLLRGNGDFVGNYELKSITHIDQILTTNFDEIILLEVENVMPFTLESLTKNETDFDRDYPLEISDIHFERLFGEQKDNIIAAVQNQTLNMSQVFDLIKGNFRHPLTSVSRSHFDDMKPLMKTPPAPVVLLKDLVVEVIIFDEEYKRVSETWAKAGDTILQTNQYADFERDNKIFSLRLKDDEFIAPSLSQKITNKREIDPIDRVNKLKV